MMSTDAGIYGDFAIALVAAFNAEDRDLNSATFEAFTSRCTLDERLAVFLELPGWAQRQIEETAGLGSLQVTSAGGRGLIPGGVPLTREATERLAA